MNTALLPPNPVCICLNLLLSVSHIQMLCKSVGRQQLGSVPLSCAIMGGFSGDPVFTSLFYSTFYKSALFVHIQKCLSFLLFALVFASDVLSSLVLSPFLFSVAWLRCLSLSLSVCALPSFPSASNSTS